MSLLKAMVFKLWNMKHTDHKAAQAEDAKFKSINIEVGEAYKQATKIILRIKDLNTCVGEDAGKVTTGNWNTFVGFNAGLHNTTGTKNNFIGYQSGLSNTVGNYNNFIGSRSGQANVNGEHNNFMGRYAGNSNTNGSHNCFVGNHAGRYNTSGGQNTLIGYNAGLTNSAGSNNVSIGYSAGFYELESYKLFIDVFERTNEADGRIKALIYGVFDAATANQLLRINAKLVEMPQLGNYANDAAAATGGVAIGGLYHNAGAIRVRLA